MALSRGSNRSLAKEEYFVIRSLNSSRCFCRLTFFMQLVNRLFAFCDAELCSTTTHSLFSFNSASAKYWILCDSSLRRLRSLCTWVLLFILKPSFRTRRRACYLLLVAAHHRTRKHRRTVDIFPYRTFLNGNYRKKRNRRCSLWGLFL